MRIGDRQIEPGEAPYVIAEIGVNHHGSTAMARQLVDAAREANADAIKLQFFRADLLISNASQLAGYQSRTWATNPRELLEPLELSVDALKTVAELARNQGLDPIVTVFSAELVQAAETINWTAYKTASTDITNRPLLEALACTRRPMLVSTGAATLDEVGRAVQWLEGCDFALLQCVSAYPTPDKSAGLAGIRALSDVAPVPLGYSDHTTAIDTGALAVAAGASILEKHLTLDRTGPGPDNAMSLEPQQFAEYVQLAQRAYEMLGDSEKRVLGIEQDVKKTSRQSIVARRRLDAGHVLMRDDLTIKRPGIGIEPWRLDQTIGRRLARTVEADTPLTEQDLETAGSTETERTITTSVGLGSG